MGQQDTDGEECVVIVMVQGGPLQVRNGVITLLNGPKNGFAWSHFTLLTGAPNKSIYNWIVGAHLVSILFPTPIITGWWFQIFFFSTLLGK